MVYNCKSMSNSWLFRSAVRSAANISFPDSRPRLPLFGHTADTQFAILDGRFNQRGDLGFLVLRTTIQDQNPTSEEKMVVYVDRVPSSCIITSQEGEAFNLRLSSHTDRIAEGILSLNIDDDHPYGSTFNGEELTPEDFWGLPTTERPAKTIDAAEETQFVGELALVG